MNEGKFNLAGDEPPRPSLELENEETQVRADIDDLRKALEEQQRISEENRRKADEYLDNLKRLKADFENFQKREIQNRQNFIQGANRDLIVQFLPLVDDMEKALEESRKHAAGLLFLEGFELIYRKMMNTLEKMGVRPTVSVGEKFDPKYHEAVMMVSSPGHEDYAVVEEIRKGYLFHEEMLRAAQVKVNRSDVDKFA
ncbi:MAG TPA: nucleotide exchange factor GrpE [Atribacteraceae bacterium]|nr:nucleotide exchange factor GrpE [Atribacteraceae bacterium]